MALSATVTPQEINDITKTLQMHDSEILVQSFNRKNLRYSVFPKSPNLVSRVAGYINQHHKGESGIIYCNGRDKCEDVAAKLSDRFKISALPYHALYADKEASQEAWMKGECKVIVATIAFGLGINKGDGKPLVAKHDGLLTKFYKVRFVIHLYMPSSLSACVFFS
jgi:superfamily II DNA helicase RecQ